MKTKILSLTTVLFMLMALVAPASLQSVSAEGENDTVIFSSNFDDGNMDDWTPFGGGGKLSLYSGSSNSGENCLRITERDQAYHGPSITADSLFQPNKTYNFSAWAYQDTDSVKTLLWTLRYVDSLGTSHFTQVAGADLEPKTWTELSGQVPIPDDSVAYLLYFECANATADFCIDDVVITGESAGKDDEGTENSGFLYNFDFEETNEMWAPRGDNRLIRTDEHSHTGTHSIYVTNRTRTWNGPTVNVNNIKREVNYFYSAYIMYNGEEYENSHNFRMEVQYNLNGEAVYQLITEKTVKKGIWTRITGTFTLPEHACDIAFYLQTANLEEDQEITDNDLMSFYTDTVTIAETSVVHAQTAKITFIILAAAVILVLLLRYLIIIILKHAVKNNAVLESISKDAMTQSLNRNAYEKRLEELEKNPELCKSLYFALCDVNFLKYINDNHGHEKGDEAITRCAKLLMATVGSDGDVYRTGGDEFVCISTRSLKDEIRAAIAEEAKTDNGYPFAVASGFTEYDKKLDTDKPDIKAIIERCDKEMYADKQDIKSKNKEYSRK